MLLPLKQGLKRIVRVFRLLGIEGCYATSIKTRIETAFSEVSLSGQDGVVMLLPLKQGLKPCRLCQGEGRRRRCYATSIKTRIETYE